MCTELSQYIHYHKEFHLRGLCHRACEKLFTSDNLREILDKTAGNIFLTNSGKGRKRGTLNA